MDTKIMEADVVQAFNKAVIKIFSLNRIFLIKLISMHDCKGGQVSKQTVVEITKAAMNAVRYYKHVVFIMEKYLLRV